METFWSLIFGTEGGSLFELWSAVEGSHPLVAFVSVLSTGLLAYLAIVAVYTVVITVIDTMRTGRPGGDVASVWSVIRMVTSLAGLLPIFKGYSAFSLIVLSVAYGANSLGNAVMRPYADSMIARPDGSGQTYAAVVGDMKSGAGDQIVAALYQSGVCATGMNTTTEGTSNPVNVEVQSQGPEVVAEGYVEYIEAGVTYGSQTNDMARDGCGSVSVVVPTNSTGEALLSGTLAGKRATDLHRNILESQQEVQRLVDETFSDPNLPRERVETRLRAIADAYDQRDAADRASLVRLADQAIQARMVDTSARVGGASWMLAGGWYYDFGKAYQTLHDTMRAQPNVKPPDWNNFSPTQMQDLGSALATLDETSGKPGLVEMLKRYSTVVTRPYSGPLEIIAKSFYDGSKAVEKWTSLFLASTGDDPVRSIQNLGFTMLSVVEAAWAMTIMVRALAATAKDADALPAVDTGVTSGIWQIISDVTNPLMAMWWALFGFAVALAYYLPLLPAILFTFAVISWLLDVIEGILAAGFFAVMNAMPEGTGFFSSYGQAAIGALLGILIRPAIMVGTLIVSVFVMSFGAKLLLYGFNTAQSDAFQNYTMGLVSTLALFAIFTIIMLALARKVFGMIVTVPEAVGQWIGARFAGRGDEASVNEIEGRFGFAGAMQALFNRRGGQRKGAGTKQGSKRPEAPQGAS